MFKLTKLREKKFLLPGLIILGVVVFLVYRNMNFSKEIVKLELLGAEQVAVGQEVEYTVTYKNNGNFSLEKPRLVILLPEHSLTEDGKERVVHEVDDLYPGQERFIKFKARLLGKEGEIKTIRSVFSYVPHNLSVRYESETSLSITIKEVPITLTYDAPLKAEKGKEISYSINYFSTIDYPLENLTIRLEPVAGFTIKSSDPTSLDTNAFDLDVLQKGKGGKITIKGIIGENATNPLVLAARLGMWVDGVFVVIKEARQEVEVTQPLLSVSQKINGAWPYITSPGETLHYQITVRNLATTSSDDIFVLVKLDGSAFDMATMQSARGQVRPNEHAIAFDSRQIWELSRLAPQQEASVDFTIRLQDTWTPADSEKNNTIIKNTITASGITEEFSAKVNSKIDITQKAVASEGSYQIIWQVKNYFNDVKNVKVKAQLPAGISLNDFIMPESEADHFSFDSNSREIMWSVGSIPAGIGVTSAPLALVFEVSAPGSSPGSTLVGQATISGEDAFTGQVISSTTSPAASQ